MNDKFIYDAKARTLQAPTEQEFPFQ